MKTLNFNKNSWHFKLATKLRVYDAPYLYEYGNGDSFMAGDSADICTYSKAVFLSLLLVFLGTVISLIITTTVIHMILGVYFSILMGQWFFSSIGNAGVIVLGAAGLWVSLYVLIDAISNSRRNRTPKKKHDTFISNAYKSWKNKFCVPIKFIE